MIKPIITEYRDLLFPIAYNLLGSVSDAEDLVQETMLKWLSMDGQNIKDERAYLVRMLVNKCLNFLRDRKKEDVTDVATYYPDVLVDQLPLRIEQESSMSLGVQALLARLSPVERAVFLLKEVFGFSHKEIAEILDISEANCRQLLRRARQHLHGDKDRFSVDITHQQELLQTLVEVCQGRDLGGLVEILKEDIQIDISRPAAAWMGEGRVAVAEQVLRWAQPHLSYRLIWLKGLPALVAYLAQHPQWMIQLDTEGRQISRLNITLMQPETPALAVF